MTFRFVICAAMFPGLRLRIAAERFCYTARHYDFRLRRGD
jgi:hypothetical protein